MPDPFDQEQVVEQGLETTPVVEGQLDLNTLQVSVGEGHQMSVADLQKSYDEARGKMHTTLQSATELQNEYDRLKQETQDLVDFRNEVESNPALYEHIQGFYQEHGYQQPQAIDPNAQQVQSLQAELNQIKQGQQFDMLERQLGVEIPDQRRHEVRQHMNQRGIGDIRAAYFDIEGPNLLKSAQKQGMKEGAAMAQRGQGVPQHPQTTNPPKEVDYSKLEGDAFDNAVLAAIAETDIQGQF
jgi:hypothetical protein